MRVAFLEHGKSFKISCSPHRQELSIREFNARKMQIINVPRNPYLKAVFENDRKIRERTENVCFADLRLSDRMGKYQILVSERVTEWEGKKSYDSHNYLLNKYEENESK